MCCGSVQPIVLLVIFVEKLQGLLGNMQILIVQVNKKFEV